MTTAHNTIHVLYIITKLELGGAQKVCLSLLNDLQKAGIGTSLISGSQGKLVKEVQKKENIILLDDFKRELSPAFVWQELKCFITLIKKIRTLKKKNPNLVVHTHSTKAGLMGRWAALFAGVKKRVHTIHGYAFHDHQPKVIWLMIYLAELITSFITTHFVCVSSKDAQTGSKLFPGFKNKHSIIRAAINWDQFYIPAYKGTPFPHEQEPFTFGTIACFKKQKNLLDLFRAFYIVHKEKPNTRLEVIGDGSMRTELEQWITDHRLQDAITLHGWQKNVAPFMQKWHAFVLSSLWEGLPCAVVEARLLKLPVLTYETGGIGDIILPGENGFLYEQGNWHGLAKGMLMVSYDKELYSKLQAYPEELDDFKNSTMVQQHITLYQELFF